LSAASNFEGEKSALIIMRLLLQQLCKSLVVKNKDYEVYVAKT
jgi:hypothetical protein